MGAMLLARSATASTGRRSASSEPQPEPLIPGLVPDQPAPGAVTDRVHKAIYCRQQAAELSQPGRITTRGLGRPAADAGGQMPQGRRQERFKEMGLAVFQVTLFACRCAVPAGVGRSLWLPPAPTRSTTAR